MDAIKLTHTRGRKVGSFHDLPTSGLGPGLATFRCHDSLPCLECPLSVDGNFHCSTKKGYHEGTISLRRLQFALAQQGERNMLVWLGKQWLNQAERVDQPMSGPDGGPIQVQQADLSKLTTDC